MKKILEEYPKKAQVKGGVAVSIRPMVKKDKEGLIKFFNKLPEKDRMYLRDDVSKPEVIEKWVRRLDYERVLPLLALKDDEIIGDATLHMEKFGWKKHIGEIRIVIAPDYRKMGIGALLAKELFHIALKLGIKKMMAEMMVEQVNAIRVFEKLGFIQEAVLSGHVVDPKSKPHNLVIMTNDVDALWQKMQDYERDDFPSYSTEGGT